MRQYAGFADKLLETAYVSIFFLCLVILLSYYELGKFFYFGLK